MDVYIYGLSKKSDLFRNILEHMENVRFKGYLSDRPQCFDSIRGAQVKLLDELVAADCDAIIAVNDNWLRKNLPDVIRHKVIDSSLFAVPGFTIEKYLKIVWEKWCIVSEDCWGGLCYSYLKMEFTSPFINTSISSDDYYNLLADLPSHLASIPYVTREENLDRYAVMRLSDDVEIELFHYKNGNDALGKWNERMTRLKQDSPVLVKKTILNDEDAERFSSLPYRNKVGFYYKETGLDGIVCLYGWNDPEIRYRYNWDFKRYVRDSVAPSTGFLQYDAMGLFKGRNCENVQI